MLGAGAGGALHEAAGGGGLRLGGVERQAQGAGGVGQRAADDQAARVGEVGAGVGLEAQDGAVVEQPAQELGLRHDLGQMVDGGEAEVAGAGRGLDRGMGRKSTSWKAAGPSFWSMK